MTNKEFYDQDCCGTCRYYWLDEDGILMCRNDKSGECWAEKEPRDICEDYVEDEE